MNWAQLAEMHEGGMGIGSHGVHHRMLAKLPEQLMRAEIDDSRSTLAARLKFQPQVISYPVGGFEAFDDEVLAAASNAGFRMGCTYVSGTNRLDSISPYALRRLHVERGVDVAWFQGMLELPELFSYSTNMLIG